MSIVTTQIICQEGDDQFGQLIKPGALDWDLESSKMLVHRDANWHVPGFLGQVLMIWREGNDLVAGIEWQEDTYDEEYSVNTTIYANKVKHSGTYQENNIEIDYGLIRAVFLSEGLPWGNGALDPAVPRLPGPYVGYEKEPEIPYYGD